MVSPMIPVHIHLSQRHLKLWRNPHLVDAFSPPPGALDILPPPPCSNILNLPEAKILQTPQLTKLFRGIVEIACDDPGASSL
jgi:hypothetical protein